MAACAKVLRWEGAGYIAGLYRAPWLGFSEQGGE